MIQMLMGKKMESVMDRVLDMEKEMIVAMGMESDMDVGTVMVPDMIMDLDVVEIPEDVVMGKVMAMEV
jgi:hypothetical protein